MTDRISNMDALGFAGADSVRRALEAVARETGAATVGNLQGLSLALFYAALTARLSGPHLLVARDDAALDRIEDEIHFARGIGLLPESIHIACLPDYDVFEMDAPLAVEDRRRRRLNALYHLYSSSENAIIIATPGGALRHTMNRAAYRANTLELTSNVTAKPETTSQFLLRVGYERRRDVDSPGRFCPRGGVLDVWPAHESAPVRVEFFGNAVDSIRRFDPQTQRSRERLERVALTPASEVIPENPDCDAPILRKDHCELIRRGIYFDAGVLYPSLFGSASNPLRDGVFGTYTIADPDGTDRSWDKSRSATLEWLERKVFPDPHALLDNVYAPPPMNPSTHAKHIRLIPFTAGNSGTDLPVKMLPPLPLDLAEIARILRRESADGRVAIISRYKKRLESFLDSEGLPGITLIEGSVQGGFRLDDARLSVFTDTEMFQRRRDKPRVVVQKDIERRPITAPADIEKGDYVVHVDHGVGRYNGITTQTSPDGVTRDFFSISYARGDNLFVPIDQIDRIEKFIGAGAAPPRVYPLHSARWGRVKQKVRKKIEDMASTLYALYTERERVRGFAFAPDNLFLQELEDSFPFEETEDQLRAIERVKADMENPRPMDHLVYGDVGYGKTEVAIRAAFKAVLDKKQAAVLAPTTILTQQHGRTFRERLGRFPVSIEVLNRFRSTAEKRRIIKRLAAGDIDIIIGTHALLQDSVKFKDLGLLVVDEEQRFGVKHKERLKMIRLNVDVLTLTATPIPRTLHMSMINLRDMSVIETPPEDRKAVKTFVDEWNLNALYAGLERELMRGGQVYYVHNEIASIGEVEAFLSSSFPDARIAVCHGQMPSAIIEQTMDAFMEKHFDILLSTTIIENGLDIPNVNTLIVDGAENFGLSQMYQLRGRVGRSFRQSYAYFFYSPYKTLNDNARKRLDALRDFADLGSGYRLAMKDLEIRGAGNLLGREQHGFITEIGFNLYCRMLAESVDRVRGTPAHIPPPVEIDLAVSAFIPREYVTDTPARTDLYKRLVAADGIRRVARIEDEITDRFGKPPAQARNFLMQTKIRILASSLDIAAVKTHPHNGLTDITFRDPDALTTFRKLSYPADFDLEVVYLKDRLRFMHNNARTAVVMKDIHNFLENAAQTLAVENNIQEPK